MDIRVPVSCTATVYVPDRKDNKVKVNGRKIKRSDKITLLRLEDGYAVYNVNSGNYLFESGL
jgi:alpha-L-rhamnosidase